jgi:hypothetical protein
MTTEYTIYLINNSASTQLFWCFLAPPVELASDPGVFANSSTSLAVASIAPGVNTFTIPVQYVVGAGASNNAVGLNIKINSSITQNAELGEMWDANYMTIPPNMGPSMMLDGATVPPTALAIKSNAFNRAVNEAAGWFSNMSYGIQTNQGFIGMSWSPDPSKTRTLTPTLNFYIATGNYGANSLASWTDVSNNSAQLIVPSSFQFNKTTVTYTATGTWTVTPGEPKLLATGDYLLRARAVPILIQSHRLLSEAHAKLVALAEPYGREPREAEATLEDAGADNQTDKLVGVKWDPTVAAVAGGETHLTGTLTVTNALIAGFSVFLLGGVRFSIHRAPVGGTTVLFSYSGPKSLEAIKSLFVAGAQLFFS